MIRVGFAGSILRAFAFACVTLVAACDSVPMAPLSEAELAGAKAPPVAPKIQAGDKLKVTVYGEDKLTGEYDVDPGGSVSLPLAGTIQAAGLSKAELETALAKKFRSEYLKNPKVTVDIVNFRPFYVTGEVAKPGEYPYKSGLNVISAIAVAGGNTYRASQTEVMIQRAGGTAFQKYPLSPNIQVFPGDLIRVPERYF